MAQDGHWGEDELRARYTRRWKGRDGHRCLWAQRLHPIAKTPVNPVFAVRHFHTVQRYPWLRSSFSVAHNRLAVTLSEVNSNIWMAELK